MATEKLNYADVETKDLPWVKAEKERMDAQYLFSECRNVKALQPIWKKFRKFHKLEFNDWLLERNKCRKDVYHLGITLGHDFVEHVHREMCSFYVFKNFDGIYKDGYTLKDLQNAIQKHRFLREQEMMLLAPRGSFKSTTNKVDCVSWLINCPDIRVMIVSGEKGLAEKFMREIKGYFYMPDEAEPTKFQQLFPEYIMTDGDNTKTTPIYCPARVIQQEGQPSLWINSVESNLSGWHTDILKLDDAVTDENSNTPGTREKVNLKISGAFNLLDEWGFVDWIGTRYFPDDAYGERIKITEIPLKFLKRAAWALLPEFKDVKLEDLEERMVQLYFPEKLDFKSLRGKLLRNKEQFLCQQMNEPAGLDDLVNFEEDAMRAAHEPNGPTAGEVWIAFDTSSGSKSGDFSAGAACRFEKRSDGQSVMHVLDVVFGKWRNSELAIQIVNFAFKWKPRAVLIEDWAQSELVKREISTLATARAMYIPIYWHKRSPEFNAKKSRIQGLEILLTNGRIKFVGGWWTDELMKQFTNYTGDRVRRRHDDIPDAISYLQKFMPDQDRSSEFEAVKELEKDRAKTTLYQAHIFRTPPPQDAARLLAQEPNTRGVDRSLFVSLGLIRE